MAERTKHVTLTIRITDAENALLKEAAALEHRSVSMFLIHHSLKHAKHALSPEKEPEREQA